MDDKFSFLSIFILVGGLAFFLYGMNVMSTSLEKLAGSRLEVILKKMTSNRFSALILGMGITIAIQSSSALTVMLVGLVNSGVMELSQTIGVLMGSHVGTTVTGWITSLSGNQSENPFLSMLKPKYLSMIIALVGILLIMTAKHNKTKDIGKIMMGFAVLMTGMTLMGQAVEPLKTMPQFTSMLTAFRNPVMGVIVGAVFTGIIQSSAASVGILQTFANSDLTYSMAIPIIMGLNIGTCVTALLSSIGVGREARRVAVIHVASNCIGTLVLLPLFLLSNQIFHYPFMDMPISPAGVALVHTIYNVTNTIMLLPFYKQLEKLAYFVIKPSAEGEEQSRESMLDDRLLNTPAVAIEVCRSVTVEMAELARKTIIMSTELLFDYDEKKVETVRHNEELIDRYEDQLNGYIVRINKHSITTKDNRTVSKMLHCVGNFERIGDHAVNIMESAQELHDKGMAFSPDAQREMHILCDALLRTIETAFDAFVQDDLSIAKRVEPLEEVIDTLNTELKNRHIKRLQEDRCTVEMGYIYQDLLTNIERVSDHCSNIAGAMIEIDEQENIHKYLYRIKEEDEGFSEAYHEYLDHYYLELGQPI